MVTKSYDFFFLDIRMLIPVNLLVFKFKSTDFALPFLYSDSTAHSLTSQTRSQKPPRTEAGPSTERKRPVEPRVNVDVAVAPERKRPRRESERHAEAAARQREQ